MGIRQKIILLTSLILVVSVCLVTIISGFVLNSVAIKHEKSSLGKKLIHTDEIIDLYIEEFQRFAEEYSYIDNTYEYIENGKDDNFNNYYGSDFLYRNKILIVDIYDKAFNLIASAQNPNIKLDTNMLPEFRYHLLRNQSTPTLVHGISGITLINDEAAILCMVPVYDKNRNRELIGYLLMAKLLDESQLNELSRNLDIKINLYPLKGEENNIISESEDGSEYNVIYKVDKNDMTALTTKKGILNDDSIVIAASNERKYYKQSFSLVIYFVDLLFIIAIIFGYIYYRLLCRNVIRPINDLKNQFEEIASIHDFPPKYEMKNILELKSLSHSMNRMMKEMVNAKLIAEKANNAKTLFLSNISHEMRTPLNGISGMLQLLSLTELNEEQSEYIQEGRNACNRMLKLIENLMEFSYIQSEDMNVQEELISINDLINGVVSFYSTEAMIKNICLNWNINGGIPRYLIGDEKKIYFVLNEIMNNAVKFTEHGEVNISANISEQKIKDDNSIELEFSITDTGIGIPEDKLKEIFMGFFQLEELYTKRYQGVGVGLTITKILAEKMGGKLTAVSKLSEGSTFILKIPLKKYKECK